MIVALPLLKVGARFDGVPFTVKSLACTVLVFTASLRLITKSTGCVLMVLLQAGLGLITEQGAEVGVGVAVAVAVAIGVAVAVAVGVGVGVPAGAKDHPPVGGPPTPLQKY